MKSRNLRKLAVLTTVLCALVTGAFAGTFKHITVDGSLGDWTGVPLAYNAVIGPSDAIQYENVYVANDDNNLYIRFTLYSPRADAFANSYDNIFIDTDNSVSSGFVVGGIGSGMLIQWGGGYQEKNGGFNEGNVDGLGWNIAGSPASTDFELVISRGATFASDNSSVFTNDTIAILLEGDNTVYANVEFVPPSGGLAYTFAAAPLPASTNVSLITLAGSSWKVNASATDLGTNWLDQAYDDSSAGWTSGNGLFGYTPSPGSYPAINTALSSGPNTYYFRTHFEWTNDTANVAFAVTNYLSDGAVYYLNGVEVRRVRMPSGAITYGTAAATTNTPVGHADVFGIDGALLIPAGDNILEVETHQAPASSGDMVFGLSLTAAVQYPVVIVDATLPADQTVIGGQPATFGADVLGSGPLNYHWLKNGSPITDATNATYTIPLVLTNDAGNYSLRVANSYATNTTRAALLTVNSTPVVIDDIAQPADEVVVEGRPVTFNVVASGSALVEYQWFKGNGAIPGETNASYTIASAVLTNAGNYHAMVSNPASSTNSRIASLTVLADTIPPTVTGVAAASGQIVVTFSEPVDSTTANTAAFYTLSGGVNVSSAVINPGDATKVTLTTSASLVLNTVYSLKVSGVKDLFGNAANVTVSFARTITIDGNFGDWQGVAPIYSGPSGSDGAADFQDIYMSNDANSYYFRVTLYHDIPSGAGQFPAYVNMFFNTDNDAGTGYSAIGSELLIQSGSGYQEKNGSFNEGGINVNWHSLPASPGSDFEFSFSRAATFASDGKPVFTTNVLTFLFQGMNTSFTPINQAPSDGGTITYADVAPVTIPSFPLGELGISSVPGGKVALVWDPPGTLQFNTSVAINSWTNLPAATSPYVIPSAGGQQFFRLTQ